MYLYVDRYEKNKGYDIYLMILLRLLILCDKTEYDKLIHVFKIPKEELDFFIDTEPYLVKLRSKICTYLKVGKQSVLLCKGRFYRPIELVKELIDGESKQSKIDIINATLDILCRDISGDYASMIFFKSYPQAKLEIPPLFMPKRNDGFTIDPALLDLGNSESLDLAKDRVIIAPMWRENSLKNHIANIKYNSWKYHKGIHQAFKYSIINVGYVHNGIHSSTMGQLYKKGAIHDVEYIDTATYYEHIYTDGIYWRYIDNKEPIYKDEVIEDIRFPLIFEIGRLLYELEK